MVTDGWGGLVKVRARVEAVSRSTREENRVAATAMLAIEWWRGVYLLLITAAAGHNEPARW